MNREIKFRAWNVARERWVEPATIAIVADGFEFFAKGVWKPYHEPDIQLMQFTGLKDKNGKEIYEGDIVSNGGKMEVVRYVEGAFFPVAEETGCGCCSNNIPVSFCEVIGNVYQNPELLKVETN